MRQGNSNKRMRGRGGSNGGGSSGGNGPRKGPNPLSRSYESTGPDVKVRGTALHIAEKYVSLARDAQSSGDPVLAENYFQHAEHYYRIIAAAQALLPQPMQIVRSDIQSDDEDEEFDESAEGRGEQRPEPRPEQRSENRWEDRGDRGERGDRFGRNDRYERGDRSDRGERNDRGERSDRGERGNDNRFEGRPERRPMDGDQRPEPRREMRPERRPIEVEPRVEARVSDDGFMPLDAPQPFVDDVPVDGRPAAEAPRVGERAPRGRGFRTGPRPDRAERPERDGNRFEGAPAPAPAPRERRPRVERAPVDAAPAALIEPDLNALPAFLTAAPPRIASTPVVEAEAEGVDGETPRRRTRGGRGRGRRPEYEGGEAGAVAVDAPATADE